MKKFIFSLILSLPFMMFVSCSGDAESYEPDTVLTVDHTVELSGVTLLNDTFYVVAGNTIQINGVAVKTVSAQTATLKSVLYFLDDKVIASKNRGAAPNFTVTDSQIGKHYIQAAATLLRSDDSVTGMSVSLPLVVVSDASQLPSNAPAVGTYSRTVRVRK
ncbi:MAG: hypothetical protein K2J82_01830 [Muribaculaceae bacterium]|nr:hypothetical protein [Muribaculaceae bacterium]MDE6753332.1 hypothetical protein [Muribaculaceae bacterium]